MTKHLFCSGQEASLMVTGYFTGIEDTTGLFAEFLTYILIELQIAKDRTDNKFHETFENSFFEQTFIDKKSEN